MPADSARTKSNREALPSWLKLIQDGFLIWVLLGAWWGYVAPEMAAPGKTWIPEALAVIMLGMGLTLTREDLNNLRYAGKPLIIGVVLQYFVMPLGGWLVAVALGLPKLLALGVILVGACPGGTASNVVAFLARGDVALSVAMTTASTLLSPVMTPLWVWLLGSAWVPIDPVPLLWTVTQIVLIPVILGALIRRFWTPGPWILEGILPLFSIAVIAWIVGVIVALEHDRIGSAGVVLIAVIAHNAMGLILGYLGARQANISVSRRRTVSIEVGMQNSGLAVALAVAHFGPVAAIPGAIFSVWHNVTGPLLAAIWRRRQPGVEQSTAVG
ncbi:MAG: bile acid:sodium symporter family protein [Candidatus Methylomirabilales bacterium]